MERINDDVRNIYLFALKHKMSLSNVPKNWFRFEIAAKKEDPSRRMRVPGYIKIIMKYGKENSCQEGDQRR